MLNGLKKLMGFGSCKTESIAALLYTEAALASKSDFFWQKLALPQTAPMRFEVIAFHVSLLLIGLKKDPKLSQALFDYMFDDFDACFREMGVSDLRVGKHIKLYAKHFYARLKIYDTFENNDATAQSVAGFFELENEPQKIVVLMAHMTGIIEASKSWNVNDLAQGRVVFA